MARLIDADALLEFVEGRYTVTWKHDYDGGIKDACIDILNFIDNAPTVDAVPRWIPCEERLPEPNVAVLGYAPKFDNIYAVYYDSVCGWMTWSPVYDNPFPSFQGEIVAWMPLPEPYKGERRDDELHQDNERSQVSCSA